MTVTVRDEQPGDIAAIHGVNVRAFGKEQEANIVDALRSNGAVLLSLVATVDGQVVGHIMFSPISVGDVAGAALGPLAVLPEYQRQRIGSELTTAGAQRLKDAGCPFVIVLGHAEYYPRFGFVPASSYAIRCEWDVPDNVFMVLIFDEIRIQGVSGMAKYREEFSTVT